MAVTLKRENAARTPSGMPSVSEKSGFKAVSRSQVELENEGNTGN